MRRSIGLGALLCLAFVSCDEDRPVFRKGADGDSCVEAGDCGSGICLQGVCGGPDAAGGSCVGLGLAGDSCQATGDCCPPNRCSDGECVDPDAAAGGDGDDGDGEVADPTPTQCPTPVGEPCLNPAECGPNGRCLGDEGGFGFPGGYCTVDPEKHAECCPEGSERRDMAGGPRYCWKRCGEDQVCRTDEGYACLQGSCGPGEIEQFTREAGLVACADGKDNDGDDYTDCIDPDCKQEPVCLGAIENDAVLCADGLDNDGDGLTDCADEECRRTLACSPPPPPVEVTAAQCYNGTDDDED